MKYVGRIVMFAAVVAVSAPGPAVSVDLQGTDALDTLVRKVQESCGGFAGLVYLGGGTEVGEQALLQSTQKVAPMARSLGVQRTCQAFDPGEAEGLLLALDGVTIVTDVDTRQACGGQGILAGVPFVISELNGVADLQCPGCAGGVYTIADWTDGLRVLFAGMHRSAGSDLGQQSCDSDLRRTLAGRWDSLFGGGCASGPCAELRHLFRPADRSRSGALFLDLLGLPPSPAKAYCNGGDHDDEDPVRRPCAATEETCRRDGSLGLVLVAEVPENVPAADLYPPLCDVGDFRLMPPTDDIISADFRCPNGSTTLFQKCFQPVRVVSGVPSAACTAREFPIQGLLANGLVHGGTYNLFLKKPNGHYYKDRFGRPITGAHFRVHTTRVQPGGGPQVCTQSGTPAQIRCLAQASPCSVGITGFEGAYNAGSAAAPVVGIQPTEANVRRLETNPADPDAYPLARRLLLNTFVGFDGALSAQESGLASCLASESVGMAATAVGLFPLATAPRCLDFDERQCGVVELNRNACLKRFLNFCPYLNQMTVAPLGTDVGFNIAVSALGSDPEGDTIEYLWKATAGTFANKDAGTTSYTCTTPGNHTLTLTLWDGLCATTRTVPVECYGP